MKFTTEVEARTEKATAIPVPERVIAELGPAKRPRLRVKLGRHDYEARVGIMGGQYLLPLSKADREAAGVGAGDAVEVEVELAPED